MIGIIGGTGLYDLDALQDRSQRVVSTPFGDTSSPLTFGFIAGKKVVFLSRHGISHRLLPSEINYRANIFALKSVGATSIISVSAVGSLEERIHPGDIVLPEQYLDLTKGGMRKTSFFGDGIVGHVSTAKPICPHIVSAILESSATLNISILPGVVYCCVEGPRLGTQAESLMMRQLGGQIVGMTNVPEVFLAREAQLPYASLCVVTDYDSWKDDPTHHVNVSMIMEVYNKSLSHVKNLLVRVIDRGLECPNPEIRNALGSAVLTSDDMLTPEQREVMNVLRS